ncbi:hypothetical protein ABWH88_06875 [Marinobacter adhaerens]|jgi:hypothetical protein|uniref:hypothetical protein n=1 Tax=Marinobacter adhaerens TaxID=1033846 RepID=UPI001C60469E|nr:hypothetical protein [Marinobacter adhaerens]MBW4979596.1 hypothetical protein [Marinobacter adhaerens]
MEVDFSAAQTQRASQYQAQLDELEQLTESLVGAAIYTDTAAGLAATVEGEHFSVPSPDNSEFLILYRHDAGPFATEINSYPSASWLEQVADRESANEARSQRNSSTLSEHENDLIGLGVTDGDTATQLAAMQASLDEARDLIDTLMGHNQALVDALIHHHSDNADTLSFITADNGQYTPVI